MDAAEQIRMLEHAVKVAGLDASDVVVPADHQTIVGSIRLHYLDWGGSGHPILFLHGGGLNAHTWDVVAMMMRSRYRCIALDQRGHGDSEWSPAMDYGLDTHVRDIEGFIDLLGLSNPVLVGQSMGGLSAMAYSSRHCDRVAALVVVDVGPEPDEGGAQRIRDFSNTPELDSPEDFLERAVRFNPHRDREVLRRSLFYNLRRLPNGKWAFKHDQRRAGEEARERFAQERQALSRRIGNIGCPTLIVRGARSDILSDAAAQRFASALPRAQWIRVEDAGHNVQGDNPRGLLDVMRPFLNSIGL